MRTSSSARDYRPIRRQLIAFHAKSAKEEKNDILKILNRSEIHIDFLCAVANIGALGDFGPTAARGRRLFSRTGGNACEMG
jgi:hypothetical protein